MDAKIHASDFETIWPSQAGVPTPPRRPRANPDGLAILAWASFRAMAGGQVPLAVTAGTDAAVEGWAKNQTPLPGHSPTLAPTAGTDAAVDGWARTRPGSRPILTPPNRFKPGLWRCQPSPGHLARLCHGGALPA